MSLQENVDYMFAHHPEVGDRFATIKLLQGPYEGVTYCYTKFLGATEDNVRLSAIVKFEYVILDDPAQIVLDQNDFIQHIGQVLEAIVTDINQSEHPEEQMRFDEEPRDDNPSKPHQE